MLGEIRKYEGIWICMCVGVCSCVCIRVCECVRNCVCMDERETRILSVYVHMQICPSQKRINIMKSFQITWKVTMHSRCSCADSQRQQDTQKCREDPPPFSQYPLPSARNGFGNSLLEMAMRTTQPTSHGSSMSHILDVTIFFSFFSFLALLLWNHDIVIFFIISFL